MDKLVTAQVKAFDTEYVVDRRWEPIKRRLDLNFPDGRFSFLDVGGGNGVFADRVLAAYPTATGMVIDSSEYLLERNRKSDRKTIRLLDASELSDLPKFDVIFCNWILHHLVTSSDYRKTRENIRAVLRSCLAHLTNDGALSVFENDCNGVFDGFPGRAVFHLTSSRSLSPFVKRLGSNTAGVGICFLSHDEWRSEFSKLGLEIVQHWRDQSWPRRYARDLPLLIRDVTPSHYWLTKS